MIQLQSILLPSQDICAVPELYFHKNQNRIDFDGYFNLFYLEKRKVYTTIPNLYLNLELQGYTEIILVHDGMDLQRITLQEDERKQYRIRFPYDQYEKGCFWFALVEGKSECKELNGHYISEMGAADVQNVMIGIDICTFKRESYVTRNLKQLQSKILDAGLQVSDHVQIFVVDNGQTLERYQAVLKIQKECPGQISIFPNRNAGGAGGFTRGMIEILKQKQEKAFTHVLLMDDDAVVEPDTLVRIFGFLSTLKEEWKDIMVGGAMLREDYPHMLFCAGEWWQDGAILNPSMHLDLRMRKNAMDSYLTETGHEHDRYSGWWCCCYSLNVVREDNLPIPLFIHHDDIEFGLRNKKRGIVFLNGVGVWHRGAEINFPGANLYYDVRNNLIEIALHQKEHPQKTTFKILFKSMTSAAIRLKYQDVQLVYRGFADFMKGPEWLHDRNPEQLNAEIRSIAPKMYSIEELQEKLTPEEYSEAAQRIQNCRETFDLEKIVQSREKKTKAKKKHLLTYNGWLLPADKTGIKVMLPTDSPFEAYRKKKVVLYEPGSGKVLLLEKKYGELIKIIFRYGKMFGQFARQYNTVRRQYRDKIGMITNQKAWEEYLGLK